MHGQGKIISPDGYITEGEFKNGSLFKGKGKKIFSDVVMEGEFDNGLLNGQGKKTYVDGRVEGGVFKDGDLIQSS